MNKKILFIGDIHGQDGWREIVADALPKFYPIVFLGDYVDSFTVRAAEQMFNLKEIIALKEKYPDRITLLLGNHDWAYIYDCTSISGFQWQQWQTFKKLFNDNIELFDVAWGYENWQTKKYTLATHAGIVYNWYQYNIVPMLKDENSKLYKLTEGKDVPLHTMLNYLKGNNVLWKIGPARRGTSHPGPLWADYQELIGDAYPGINQVVGHTASGTVYVDQFGDDLIAKVDGWYNKKLAHLVIGL